ncbi:MAG: GNAT family N-acetyltransferase [Streptococcaceae bacterium]|nr:GNAT family N-acetyltransferase [Streptococcaceae bacterium]
MDTEDVNLEKIEFRVGEAGDNLVLIDLVMVILQDMELPILMKIGIDETRKLFIEAMQTSGYRYASERSIVATFEGQIVGVYYGYPNEEEADVDVAIQEILWRNYQIVDKVFQETESVGSEWYLDSLVVHSDFQSQGIGSLLIEHAKHTAKASGKSQIGLNVDKGNPKAQKLYGKKGFRVTSELILAGHAYNHMNAEV